jgi:antitoxin CptB
LMEVPDHELLAWITGEADVPPNYDTALFRRLRDFNRRGEGAR